MTVPPLPDSGYTSATLAESYGEPVKKRVRVAEPDKDDPGAKDNVTAHEDNTSVRRHPLGVRPSGNAFTSSVNLKDFAGIFASLPDELLASFLETLEPQDLLRLGGTCRALHAFTRNEELWRTLFVE